MNSRVVILLAFVLVKQSSAVSSQKSKIFAGLNFAKMNPREMNPNKVQDNT